MDEMKISINNFHLTLCTARCYMNAYNVCTCFGVHLLRMAIVVVARLTSAATSSATSVLVALEHLLQDVHVE